MKFLQLLAKILHASDLVIGHRHYDPSEEERKEKDLPHWPGIFERKRN